MLYLKVLLSDLSKSICALFHPPFCSRRSITLLSINLPANDISPVFSFLVSLMCPSGNPSSASILLTSSRIDSENSLLYLLISAGVIALLDLITPSSSTFRNVPALINSISSGFFARSAPEISTGITSASLTGNFFCICSADRPSIWRLYLRINSVTIGMRCVSLNKLLGVVNVPSDRNVAPNLPNVVRRNCLLFTIGMSTMFRIKAPTQPSRRSLYLRWSLRKKSTPCSETISLTVCWSAINAPVRLSFN